uniref:Uncharacterized protein n=1 Tax=Rhizophora mucronata TaxID=61149 RepID=A0A2P2P453_RHIMU
MQPEAEKHFTCIKSSTSAKSASQFSLSIICQQIFDAVKIDEAKIT